METGILNFHDEETFSSSFYDPMDNVGSEQYSSDYLDASDSHWGTEQELNGDIAVLPLECPPRHMRALHNREDYHRAFDEWQEHLMSLQPLGPDDMELHMDSHGFPADLHTTVFQDALSFTPEPLPSVPPELLSSFPRPPRLSPIPPAPPCLSSTPSPQSVFNESSSESSESPEKVSSGNPETSDAEFDESFLSLDISNIDEKALEELQFDIKGLANGAPVTSILGDFKFGGENAGGLLLPEDSGGSVGSLPREGSIGKNDSSPIKDEIDSREIKEFDIKEEPIGFDLNEIDSIDIKDDLNLEIDALDIDMESLVEQMPVLEAGNLESLLEQFEATETGKAVEDVIINPVIKSEPLSPRPVESVKPQPVLSVEPQSLVSANPPSVVSVKPEPVVSAKPQSVVSAKPQSFVSAKPQSVLSVKLQSVVSALPQPVESFNPVVSVKSEPVSLVKPNPSVETTVNKSVRIEQEKVTNRSKLDKNCKATTNSSSQLHKNIRDALPAEVIDRIKACGRRKEVPIIPAPVIPSVQNSKTSSRQNKSAPRNQRNKINQKALPANQIQLDHDYCGSKESTKAPMPAKFYNCDASEYTTATVVRSPNCKTTVQIQAKTVRRIPEYITIMGNNTKKDRKPGKSLLKSSVDWCDEKSSRKDSGLSSGDVSDDSECTTHLSGSSSGCETSCSAAGSTIIGKVKLADTPGKSKNLLMVSVLKKSSNLPVQAPVTVDTTDPSICVIPEPPTLSPIPEEQELQSEVEKEEETKPKKRKLNLEEYRSRQLERQRSENEKTIPAETLDVENATPVSLSQLEAPEPEVKEERIAAIPVKQDSPSETKSNVEAHTQTSPTVESQAAPLRAEKRRRQYRRRRSTSSTSSSSVSIKKAPKVTPSSRETPKVTESKVQSRSRSRSKSRSERKSRLKLRSTSVSSGSSSSRSRSSSTSSRSSSSSSSSSSDSSTSENSRRYSRSSRRRSRSRSGYRDSRSRRRERSRSSSRSRSRSWRRRSRSGRRCSYSHSSSRSRSFSKRRRSSRSRSNSSDSSRSYSRSRSRSRSRRYRRSRSRSASRGGRGRRPRSRNWRSRSPIRRTNWQFKENERNREIEERRVVYVGRIPEETTKAELRRRFEAFGPIIDISLHFRERADNYGFVTFAYKADAYSAVERGNNDPDLPRYDLCFGGRRKFCRERYADLDGLACKSSDTYQSPPVRSAEENSFDLLLRQAQAKLRKKKV